MPRDMLSSNWKMHLNWEVQNIQYNKDCCVRIFFCTSHMYMYTMQFVTVKSFPIEAGLTMISAKISGVVLPLLDQSLPLLYMERAIGVERP